MLVVPLAPPWMATLPVLSTVVLWASRLPACSAAVAVSAPSTAEGNSSGERSNPVMKSGCSESLRPTLTAPTVAPWIVTGPVLVIPAGPAAKECGRKGSDIFIGEVN